MKLKISTNIKRYLNFLIGTALVAIAYNVFLVQNNLVAGGVGGLAIVMNEIYGIETSTFILCTNIFLILLSFITLGKQATLKAILGSLLYPVFVKLTLPLINFIDLSSLDLLFKAVIGGLLTGVGLGMVFKEGFNTGGSNIINMILSKYLKMNIGSAILITDTLIVIYGGLIFGIELMAYSIIAVILVSAFSTKTMLDLNDHKTFYIRTSKIEDVKKYLIEGLKYDVTLFDVIGAYKNEKGKMIMVVVKDMDYYKIKNGILEIDSNAFITITNSYETANSNRNIRESI